MEKWLTMDLKGGLGIFFSLLFIYIFIILFTRIFGKRSFSKMSGFDFPMTIAVGSIIAGTVLSPNPSLNNGIFGLLLVFVFQLGAAYLRRYKTFESLIDNKPLLLMDGEKVLIKNLLKARVTETDLRAKLREANVTSLSEIRFVVFETTGDISVLTSKSDNQVDAWIMTDV
ncbi:MAG: YetF domain-containing protein, partial [Pelobium sp.]